MDIATALDRLQGDADLKRWLSQQWALRVEALTRQLSSKEQQLRARDLKIQALTLELAHLKRMRYGMRSEALSAEQRSLFEDNYDEDTAAIASQLEPLARVPADIKRTPTGRKPLPKELPRIEHRHEPERCTCAQCGQALVKIGEDVSEQLDVEPAWFFVHRHIRPQYACRACETVTAAPVPAAVIDGGLAAPGLHAWVLTQKYLDHLPLYRIEQISARHGVPLARSTLAQWVGRLGVALQPLVDRLADHLKRHAVLHADETPVQQLDSGTGKTRRAWLWAYRSNSLGHDSPIVVFDYRNSRGSEPPQHFLRDWRGHLMVDDYAGYKTLLKREDVIELACLAHVRRKFYELNAQQPHALAQEALHFIAKLYAIEASAREHSAQARYALRQQEAKPIWDAWQKWLLRQRARTAHNSGLGKAIDHALKRWPALLRYLDDGSFPIDNNGAENAIRPICLGKKNWLFTGSERAGQRAAAIQSLLATAKLNGLEPYAWLKDTLEKLPAWPNRRLDELLPLRSADAS
jgi:transposase